MYNKQLKSPAQMEKSAKNVFKKKLESKVTKVSSGVTLVSDTDTRPAVSGSMQLLAGELGKINRKQETGNE